MVCVLRQIRIRNHRGVHPVVESDFPFLVFVCSVGGACRGLGGLRIRMHGSLFVDAGWLHYSPWLLS